MTRRISLRSLAGLLGLGAVAKGQNARPGFYIPPPADQPVGALPISVCFTSDDLTPEQAKKACAYHKAGNPIGWQTGKPLNNQCPVCGTRAARYKPDTRFCGGIAGGQPRSAMGLTGCEPTMTIIRCAFCNCAFWVDAE